MALCHHRERLPDLRNRRDPELDDPKPTDLRIYLLELIGWYWWTGKLQTHWSIARGRVAGYGFLNENTRPDVVRSVRLQLLVYAVAIAVSFALWRPLFVTYWLLPVALGQPLLRAILLAEHTGCSEDANGLTNTRTTLTMAPVRALMWNMPFHAEHHLYPSIPFHQLPTAHQRIRESLANIAPSYVAANRSVIRSIVDIQPQEEHG